MHSLQVVLGNEHISFATTKLGSLLQVQSSKDPEGLRVFYYLVQVGCLCCVYVFRFFIDGRPALLRLPAGVVPCAAFYYLVQVWLLQQ